MTDIEKIEKLEQVIRIIRNKMTGILISTDYPSNNYRAIKNTTKQDVYKVAYEIQNFLKTNILFNQNELYFKELYNEEDNSYIKNNYVKKTKIQDKINSLIEINNQLEELGWNYTPTFEYNEKTIKCLEEFINKED